MQRVIIDCQTGQVEIIRLNIDEEFERLNEIEQARELAENQRKIETKQLLISALVELREMELNKNIFTDKDIAEKQAEVDSHLGAITQPLNPARL